MRKTFLTLSVLFAFSMIVLSACGPKEECMEYTKKDVEISTEKVFDALLGEFVILEEETEEPSQEITTIEVTTEEATTQEPTTSEPTTSEPTTPEITTEEPTTEELTTPEPTTVEPTTPEPTTPEPTTVEPTTPEPTTPEATTEEITTPEPTTEEATTSEPVTESKKPVPPWRPFRMRLIADTFETEQGSDISLDNVVSEYEEDRIYKILLNKEGIDLSVPGTYKMQVIVITNMGTLHKKTVTLTVKELPTVPEPVTEAPTETPAEEYYYDPNYYEPYYYDPYYYEPEDPFPNQGVIIIG